MRKSKAGLSFLSPVFCKLLNLFYTFLIVIPYGMCYSIENRNVKREEMT